MSLAWSTLMRATRYGYSPLYIMRIEGIDTLLMEYVGDAVAPSGYSLEGKLPTDPDRGLVIDRSPQIGPVIDDDKNLPKAHDLTVLLFDTDTTRTLFARPTHFAALTHSMSAIDTSINVTDTTGWPAPATAHIGASAMPIAGRTKDTFVVTRGLYGRSRSYRAGALVTDTPYVWRGRRVELFAVLLGPTERYVQGADILSQACAVWSGYVSARPRRDGTMWRLDARDQVRRLFDPLSVAASGQARFVLGDDAYVDDVDKRTTFHVRIAEIPGAEIVNVQVQPFAAITLPIRRSQLRSLLASALDTAITSALVGTPVWVQVVETARSGGLYRYYRLQIPVTSAAQTLRGYCTVTGAGWGQTLWDVRAEATTLKQATSSTVGVDIPLWQPTRANGAGLAVTLDAVAPSDLPPAGWVLLEDDAGPSYQRYTAITTDPSDARVVHLSLDPTTAPTDADIHALARAEAEGTVGDVSATFLWRMDGQLKDIVRQALTSTGDAVHGAYDTLPKGQGLGLPDIDDASFDAVFGGAFDDLSFDIAAESGTPIAKLLTGILRLSGRALTTRRAADGSAVQIAAVSIGSADGLPVATISDRDLVSSQGRPPVETVDSFGGPQAIEVKCRVVETAKGTGDRTILLQDPHLIDWSGERWQLDIYGVGRSALLAPAWAWALNHFRAGENRQAIVMRVGPQFDVQPGDIVLIDSRDPNLWNYAFGTAGYTGLARAVGAPWPLTHGVQALTVIVDGLGTPGPFAPSLPIVAVAGGATTPTSIDVDDEHLDLLVYAADGESSWKVQAYLPGQDSGEAEYTVSTVTSPGGGVARLTVTAYPSAPAVTLTTAHRLTWCRATEATEAQGRYLHNTDRVQWG